MKKAKILSIGDAVCDKYLSRNKMYPGGQCVNTCAYAVMNGVPAAYLGKFGTDEVAACLQDTLAELKVDTSHCRHFPGENGFACVTLVNHDRVFIGSNKGGIAAVNPYGFTDEDWEYIKSFDLIYTNLNAFLEEDLPAVAATGVPVAFDFSNRWTDEYLAKICPHIRLCIMSCAHLDDETREQEMRKAARLGVPIVLGTIGEDGSYLLWNDQFFYAKAVKSENVIDTMGAGDAYFATFLCYLLTHPESPDNKEAFGRMLTKAMAAGADFSARMCCKEGAFGYGVPLTGRTIDNRL